MGRLLAAYLTSGVFRKQLLGWVRAALATVGGILVRDGYVTTGTISPEVLTGLATILVTCAFSSYDKFVATQKQFLAQALPAGTTEQAVTNHLTDGLRVPSVLTPATVSPGVLR